MRKLLTFLLIGFLVFACGRSPTSATGLEGAIAARLNDPFQLRVEQVATLPTEQLQVNLVRVQDSRCPSDVTCVWAGQAIVVVHLMRAAQDLGELELVLSPGNAIAAAQTAGGYTIQLTALTPYPSTQNSSATADYTATLVISKP